MFFVYNHAKSLMPSFITAILHFWLCHPALFYGLSFLLGVAVGLGYLPNVIIPSLFLWLPFIYASFTPIRREFIKPLVLNLLTFVTAWIYVGTYFLSPSLPPEGMLGKAQICIKNISLQSHTFGKRWVYRCEIRQFYPVRGCLQNTSQDSAERGKTGSKQSALNEEGMVKPMKGDEDRSSEAAASRISEVICKHPLSQPKSIASSLPCLLTLPAKEKSGFIRPLAQQEYWVSGKLLQTKHGTYLLKVSSKAVWKPIDDTFTWAEWRWQWKKKVSDWIKAQFTYSQSAAFLAGLVTGEFDDYWMRQQFSRFGLQHLLAISGFHFAIIAGFLSFALSLFIGSNLRISVLLVCLSLYCFFLGPQSSILRAWLMCSLAFLGGWFEKRTFSLNLLGLALLVLLVWDPHVCQELGFQLSFGTTAAIFLFYAPAKTWLDQLFPRKILSDVLQFNSWNQHAYCVLGVLKQGLALTLAVNLFALPTSLFYFKQFPILSIMYNLFFPILASVSLCLLLLGSAMTFVPFLGAVIHGFNDRFTLFVLQLASQVPIEVDVYVKMDVMNAFWLTTYMSLAYIGGIIYWASSKQEERQFFAYI